MHMADTAQFAVNDESHQLGIAPSTDQLAALGRMFDNMIPHAEYSIWDQLSHWIVNMVRMNGVMVDANGPFRDLELHGPPTCKAWSESCAVFKTVGVLLDTIDLGGLEDYCDLIDGYHWPDSAGRRGIAIHGGPARCIWQIPRNLR